MLTLSLTLLAAAPDAGGAPAWKITWTSRTEVDHGDGRTVGTETTTVVVTPTEVRVSEQKAQPLDPAKRDAIAALLPLLEGKAGTWSLSDYVNDEGSHDERLVVERGAKVLRFSLIQGRRAPRPPAPLAELYPLVTGNPLPAR